MNHNPISAHLNRSIMGNGLGVLSCLVISLVIATTNLVHIASGISEAAMGLPVILLLTVQFTCLSASVCIGLIYSFGLRRRHLNLALFGCSALICLYWVPLGFDITDEGRRLSFAYFFADSFTYHLRDFKFGSHLLAYLWLKLFGSAEVLWMRVGFVLIKSLSAALIFGILRRHTKTQMAFVASIFALLLSLSYGAQTLNYNNIPMLFVIASIYLLDKYMSAQKLPHLFTAGLFVGIAILCKFTMLSFAGILGLYLIISGMNNGKIRLNKSVITFGFGVIVLLAGYFLLLLIFNQHEQYFDKVYTSIIEPFLLGNENAAKETLAQHDHDPASLKKRYISDFTKVGDRIGLYLLTAAPMLVSSVLKKDKMMAASVIIFAISSCFLYDEKQYVSDQTSLVACLILSAALLRKNLGYIVLYLVLTLFVFLGSNTGIVNMYNSAGIGLIAALSIVLLGGVGVYSQRSIVIMVLCLSAIIWNKKESNIYRDLEPSKLTSAFQSKGLTGIFSNQARVSLIDSTLTHFRPIICKTANPTMIAANTIPGMNFLLNASHGNRLYWKKTGGFEVHKEYLETDSIQNFIIISKFNPRLTNWPNYKKAPCDRRDCDSYDCYLAVLSKSSTFRVAAENEGFILFAHNRNRR